MSDLSPSQRWQMIREQGFAVYLKRKMLREAALFYVIVTILLYSQGAEDIVDLMIRNAVVCVVVFPIAAALEWVIKSKWHDRKDK